MEEVEDFEMIRTSCSCLKVVQFEELTAARVTASSLWTAGAGKSQAWRTPLKRRATGTGTAHQMCRHQSEGDLNKRTLWVHCFGHTRVVISRSRQLRAG